ncbi:MAG: hypothetical protein LLG02_08375 [Pelosinus sp.]|nr:hypothetical protein [Pelosinus sp.]
MQQAIDKIFASVLSDLKQNIEYFKQNELKETAVNPRISSSGSQDVTFHLDESGYCFQKYTKYGASVIVHFKVTILAPKASYTLIIESSDGGGGVYKNMRINQPKAGIIKTSFWHATTIAITMQSDLKNADVTAKLNYSY